MPRIKKASQLGIIHIILILIIPLILIGALVAYLILSKQEVSTSNLIGKIIKPKPPTLDQLQGIWKAEKKFTFDENTQKFKESEFSGSEKDILIEFNGNDFCIGKSASENAQDLKCEGQVAFTLEAENLTLYEPENQTVVWKVHLNIQGKLELEPEMPSGQENIKIILVKAGEPRKVDPQDVANKDKLQGLWVVSQYFVFENGQFREDQIPSQYTKSYLEFKNGKICPGGELDEVGNPKPCSSYYFYEIKGDTITEKTQDIILRWQLNDKELEITTEPTQSDPVRKRLILTRLK